MTLNRLIPSQLPASLVLADGTIFNGFSFGATGMAVGEVVFNTAMTGYQEILTDPSYYRQLVTLTSSQVGNVGVNPEDCESNRVWAAGLIIRQIPQVTSNWRATASLNDYLRDQNVVAITGLDTRRLTRLLRMTGSQSGCITTMNEGNALESARACVDMAGLSLASEVSVSVPYEWSARPEAKWHVVVFDFGVKRNTLRILSEDLCRVTVVPPNFSMEEVLALRPDGILLSNGPGDPAACFDIIETVRKLLTSGIPLYGICLGHQLLALASGAATVKMKFGHHGANHPVQDLETRRVFITSQNHGFAVSSENLPTTLRITHRSLFDQTIQGIARNDVPAYGFQGHPEAGPGPSEARALFQPFYNMMHQSRQSIYAKKN